MRGPLSYVIRLVWVAESPLTLIQSDHLECVQEYSASKLVTILLRLAELHEKLPAKVFSAWLPVKASIKYHPHLVSPKYKQIVVTTPKVLQYKQLLEYDKASAKLA